MKSQSKVVENQLNGKQTEITNTSNQTQNINTSSDNSDSNHKTELNDEEEEIILPPDSGKPVAMLYV